MNDWNPFVRFPKVSFGGLVVLLIPLLWDLQHLRIRSDADALLESNPSQKATLDKITAVLQDQVIVVIDLECPDVFTAEGLSAIGRVSDALMTVDGVLDVKSLTHSYKPVRKGFSFDMVPLAPREMSEAADLEQLRDYCLGNPLIRNVMVSPDSRHATLTLTFDKPFMDLESKRVLRADLETVFSDFESEGLAFRVVGLPLVEEEVYTRIMGDLFCFVPVVFLFLAATLGVAFRSFGFVFFMLVNQAVTLGLIAGSLQWLGYPFTVFTLLLFPLWMGVHLTLLVHLGTACQRAARDRLGVDVVRLALKQIWKSCGFATLTTLVGLVSLGLAEIPQVREAGLIGAYGVAVVFLMTFGPGVGIMAVYYRHYAGGYLAAVSEVGAGDEWPFIWLEQLQRRKGWVLFLALAAIAGTVMLVPQLRTGVRPIEFLPADSPTRAAGELFNASYGGFNMFQLGVDSGKTNGVNQLPFLKYLEDVQVYAEAKSEVSGVYSYSQVLAMMNQIWEQERPGSLALPTNPLLLGTFSLVLKTQKFPFFEALCDPDYRTANLVVRTPDLRSDKYLAIIADVIQYAESKLPEGVSLSAEQGLHTILEADRQIVGSQMRSAVTALVSVFMLLVVLWRSWRLAALAIMINALPVGVVIAVAALIDIPLNSITVMIAAIAFGIAIDDTVHFVTQWLDARRSGSDRFQATESAIRVKARPIVYTSLVLGGIFALLAATSFPPAKHFGGLSALAFGLAFGVVFVLLPLCLSVRKAA
ncbi:MAG: hypothetical protein M2R45_00375 [Verrucomicrobia subdivision 3 bacterium]|nr:hypothetical protein [Limisphaerales bacterium]MCS1412867.1 hypothetical protein [Limisphaerales bacterium]